MLMGMLHLVFEGRVPQFRIDFFTTKHRFFAQQIIPLPSPTLPFAGKKARTCLNHYVKVHTFSLSCNGSFVEEVEHSHVEEASTIRRMLEILLTKKATFSPSSRSRNRKCVFTRHNFTSLRVRNRLVPDIRNNSGLRGVCNECFLTMSHHTELFPIRVSFKTFTVLKYKRPDYAISLIERATNIFPAPVV